MQRDLHVHGNKINDNSTVRVLIVFTVRVQTFSICCWPLQNVVIEALVATYVIHQLIDIILFLLVYGDLSSWVSFFWGELRWNFALLQSECWWSEPTYELPSYNFSLSYLAERELFERRYLESQSLFLRYTSSWCFIRIGCLFLNEWGHHFVKERNSSVYTLWMEKRPTRLALRIRSTYCWGV
jgi:hypothetical protein